MIIDFCHTFNTYDEILSFYGMWDYSCPNPQCHARHSLIRHGSYHRYLLTDPTEPSATQHMAILRLKCKSCGCTHAVLTADMVPYLIHSCSCILNLLEEAFGSQGSVKKTVNRTNLSHQTLYHFLRIFSRYLEKLELLLRSMGQWKSVCTAKSQDILPLLLKYPPPLFQSLFFEQYRMPLLLSRRSTVSCPFFIGARLSENESPT